jgi:hypothetical protein
MPLPPTAPARLCPLTPTTPTCCRPRSKEDCLSALGVGCHPRPCLEEDVGCRCRLAHTQRRSAHTWRRTLVTTACAPAFRRGALALGHHRSAHVGAVGLSSPTASRAAHHCRLAATAARSSGHRPLPPGRLAPVREEL